jgi:hypothetical protein
MISSKNVIAVALSAEAITEICLMADEQGSSISAVGRSLIQEALKARDRPVPEHIPLRAARKRLIAMASTAEAHAA